MTHWHGVTWDYIDRNWTESQFVVLVDALRRRLARERDEQDRLRPRGRGSGGRGRPPRGGHEGADGDVRHTGGKRASGPAGIAAALGKRSMRYPKLKSDRLAREREQAEKEATGRGD